MSNEQIATRLMEMAARRSVETQFGWAHPDCEALQEAARILRGEPVPVYDGNAVLPGIEPSPFDREQMAKSAKRVAANAARLGFSK